MKIFLVAISITLLWNVSSGVPWKFPARPSTLRLVHLLFRHGDRNPESGTFWDSNPYQDESYYPEGFGQLTNAGKRTEYNLGKLLRKRYDFFLGDIWNINLLDVRSSNVNRTKMSAELVLAGLWPPKRENIWNPLLAWQPIPYNYYPLAEDNLISPWYCTTYYSAFNEAYETDENQNYLTERYSEAMQIISNNTGIDADAFSTAASYQNVILVQEQLGLPLEDWVHQVYPEPINSLAVDNYYLMTNTTTLRQIVSGALLKKILTDTQSLINGTLSPSTRKMFVYSGHDLNVGSMLHSLDAYALDQTPPYGSTVIFEVHEIRGVFGLKLFYIDYEAGSPHPLTIPGCTHFCPFDQFYSLVEEILPESDEVCYGS